MISETTTLEQNKALYRNFIEEIFNQGRLDRLSEFLTPSYQIRDAVPGTPAGAEGVAAIVKMFRGAFPDLHITIEEQIAEGDKVCSRSVTRGTHKGRLFGVAPTNKSVSMSGLTWVRIVDGRLEESWVKNDVVSLMKQLGATALPK